MGRIIDPNDHNKPNKPANTNPQSNKPVWLGDVGEPCGYCCLTMWWIDNNTYKNCPITFPNNKEYRKFCIDYTKSILYGINTITNSNDIRNWGAFKDINAIIKKLSQDDRGGEGLKLPPNYFNSLKKNTKILGSELCENFYEILKILEGAGNETFGIDGYSWSDTGYCGSADCDCFYPCPDAAITKKVWIGSGNTCVCAEPLVSSPEGDCYCQDDNYGALSKKEIISSKARNNQYAVVYPLGRCSCKNKTSSGQVTYLVPTVVSSSHCPECDCAKASLLSQGITYYIDSIWKSDPDDAPGKCDCDDSLGLIKDTEQSTVKNLVCKCTNPNYVWDPEQNECVQNPDYVDWGQISEISTKFNPFSLPRDDCPTAGGYVEYKFDVTINSIGSADGANVTVAVNSNVPVGGRLILNSWFIDPPEGGDIILNRADINSVSSSMGDFVKSIPTVITIGKHYKKNNFSPGKRKDYYDQNIDLKHFHSSSENKYILRYTLRYELSSDLLNTMDFGINVILENVEPYVFSESVIPGLADFAYPNVGPGIAYQEDITNIQEQCTESPSESPSDSPSESPSGEPEPS